MTSTMRFTIGIAAYNAEKSINEGLESVVNQHFDLSKVEVLIVDDHSTDNTLEKIEPYKHKLNLRVIQLPENSGGPGKPRNVAIKEANGEFILFLDSDDYIAPDLLKDADQMINSYHSEVLLFKMRGVNGRGVPKSMYLKTEPNANIATSKVIYTLSPTKMFQTQLLRDNDIFFPVNLKSAEDQLFTMRAYLHAQTISILADKDYYYLVTREGEHMSAAFVAPEKFYFIMKEIIKAIYENGQENPDAIAAIFIKKHFMHSRTTNFIRRIKDPEDRKKWFTELSDFALQIPKSLESRLPANINIFLAAARASDFASYKKLYQQDKKRKFDSFEAQGPNLYGKINTKYGEGQQKLSFKTINPIISIHKFYLDAAKLQLEIEITCSIENLHFEPELVLKDRNHTEKITILPQKQEDSETFIFDLDFASTAKTLVQQKI